MTNLVFEKALGPDDLLEEVLAHMGIHSGQGVVQEVDVWAAVGSPGQADPLLLASRQVNTLEEGQRGEQRRGEKAKEEEETR